MQFQQNKKNKDQFNKEKAFEKWRRKKKFFGVLRTPRSEGHTGPPTRTHVTDHVENFV
jgi:hypothetical protein